MSAKNWGNCVGGIKCWLDPVPRRQMKKYKRGWRRLLRRQNKKDTIQRRREAA